MMERKAISVSSSFKVLEHDINEKLKELGGGFTIRHLTFGPDGKYRFELSVAVDPDQSRLLERALRAVLKDLPTDRLVQAKFYLPESIAMKVKQAARQRRVSQSTLVTECLKSLL